MKSIRAEIHLCGDGLAITGGLTESQSGRDSPIEVLVHDVHSAVLVHPLEQLLLEGFLGAVSSDRGCEVM